MKIKWILFSILFLILLIILKLYSPQEYNFYPKCLFYVTTGWQCSGCGNLRASHALLNGLWNKAWQYNASIFFLIPYFFLGFLSQLLMSKYLWAQHLYYFLFNKNFEYLIIIGLLVFTIYRNI